MNKENLFIKGLILIIGISFWSCSSSKEVKRKDQRYLAQKEQNESVTVGEVDGQRITYHELLRYYHQNGIIDSTKKYLDYKDLSSFLNLYLKYKAKLTAARQNGYFHNPEILKEYHKYANEYAFRFWFNHKIKKELLDQLYQRSDSSVHVEHILIRLSLQAPPQDTIKVWNRLMKARQEFSEGVPFKELIQDYSSKHNGRPLGGNLGYISAGMTVLPFENAIYHTPVSKVSMPVRTRYGYHLIFVKDKRKKISDREISHIFFRTKGKGYSIASAMKKAEKVYKKLQNGASWNKLVMKYSEDPGSKRRDGYIGWIRPGQYRPGFSDTVFSIPHSHTYTHPFYSGYGVHIVRLDSIQTFKSISQKKEYLSGLLKRLPRYREHDKLILKQIREKGNAQVNDNNYWKIQHQLTRKDTLNIDHLSLSQELLNEPLFRINGKQYFVRDFISWLHTKMKSGNVISYHYYLFQEFKEYATKQQLGPVTAKIFPRYGRNVRSYLNGLVAYKFTQDSVWNYAQTDTLALKKLYHAKPQDYRYNTRYRYYEITADNDSTLEAAVMLVKKGISPDSLTKSIKGIRYFSKGSVDNLDSEPFSKLKGLQNDEFSKPFMYHNRHMILYLEKILSPREMTFKEAYDKLVSDYQPIRKKQWEQSLQKRYHVTAYPNKLKQALGQNSK